MPGVDSNAIGAGRTPMPAAAACDDRPGDRVFRLRLDARGKPQHLVLGRGPPPTEIGEAGLPTVSVPVLSKAMSVTSRSVCSASPLRNSTPSSAARPVPVMIAAGVASPMAQGQAMMSTATALTSAIGQRRLRAEGIQTTKVSAAAANTAGTNTRDAVDHRLDRQLGALRLLHHADDAGEHRVGADAGRAKTKPPVRFTVAPVTVRPALLATGAGSPVIIDSST